MTIADAAAAVLREHGADMVVWGDCGLLDEIGSRAGMKLTHPLNRHARILDALGRSRLFEKRWGLWNVTRRRVRGFMLCGVAAAGTETGAR